MYVATSVQGEAEHLERQFKKRGPKSGSK